MFLTITFTIFWMYFYRGQDNYFKEETCNSYLAWLDQIDVVLRLISTFSANYSCQQWKFRFFNCIIISTFFVYISKWRSHWYKNIDWFAKIYQSLDIIQHETFIDFRFHYGSRSFSFLWLLSRHVSSINSSRSKPIAKRWNHQNYSLICYSQIIQENVGIKMRRLLIQLDIITSAIARISTAMKGSVTPFISTGHSNSNKEIKIIKFSLLAVPGNTW